MELKKLLENEVYLDETAYAIHLEITSRRKIVNELINPEKKYEDNKYTGGHEAPPERGLINNSAEYNSSQNDEAVTQGIIYGMTGNGHSVVCITHHGIPGIVDFDDTVIIGDDDPRNDKIYKLVARNVGKSENHGLVVSINNLNFGRKLYGKKEGDTIEWLLQQSPIDKLRGKDPVTVKKKIKRIVRGE